jgi:DNA-directed RNA polymerase subunit L
MVKATNIEPSISKQSKIIVSDITITDLSPKIKNAALEKYMPKTLFPKRMEFQISGVTNAISNAIRRTMCTELLTSGLDVDYRNIVTNDMFIIPEMIISRFRMIPIDQNTPLGAQFELNAINVTDVVRDVKASEIRIVDGGKLVTKLPFNETFTICTLEPGKSIKIEKIGIHQSYGFIEGYGAHVIAVNCASVAIDQKPINMYEPESGGIPSSLSNPQVWKISFNTNGTMPPKNIVLYACNNIIERVESIRNLLYSIQNNGDEYVLTVDGESDTIGNLFMKTALSLFPDIRAIVYSTSSVGRILTLRIRCDEDINTIYDKTIRFLTSAFTEIKKFFE